MKDITKKYSNNDITVVWKPSVCIHSTICWKGLVAVFNPREKPWIKMEGAETEKIIEQVQKCPSGALSFYYNNKMEMPVSVEADTKIEAVPNGPLMVYGNVSVKDASGKEIKRNKVTAFCRCGHSNNKPFCDGSHVTAKFQG